MRQKITLASISSLFQPAKVDSHDYRTVLMDTAFELRFQRKFIKSASSVLLAFFTIEADGFIAKKVP
jgi:hypothetical protein